MPVLLLNTDTLSEIIKRRNTAVVRKADEYVARHGPFSFSLMTRFEILRGLKAKHATAQLSSAGDQVALDSNLRLR